MTVSDAAGAGGSAPTGTVRLTSSGPGGFFGSPCTLSGSGVSASCAGFFTSLTPGWQAIIASYGGDDTHTASINATLVSVALPPSTAGCLVFGHGRITAANGDHASFLGLAVAAPPRGVEFYRDNGPANAFGVRSLGVDALTCSADGTRASSFGKASINGAGSYEYRIDTQLAADRGAADSYRIRLSNGYDSGAQPIHHGNVSIYTRNSAHHHHDPDAEQNQNGEGQDGT